MIIYLNIEMFSISFTVNILTSDHSLINKSVIDNEFVFFTFLS